MARKFKFCLRCRRTISENEVQRGLFVQTPNGMLCATCAQQLDEETEAAKQLAPAPSTTLRADPSEAERPVQAPVPVEVEMEPIPETSVPATAAPVEKPVSRVPSSQSRERPTAEANARPREATVALDPPSGRHTGASEPPSEVLGGIREHLEQIHRALVFEKSSPWNVLATIAQCLAVGMLILGAINWAEGPTHLLLVALIFQVMALTFFVRGK